MSSFFIRGLARIFALSYMERNSRTSTSSSSSISTKSLIKDQINRGAISWNNNMKWLIPFVQASGFCVVISNPKSHEEIIIDKNCKSFPYLSAEWLNRFDVNEIKEWMEQDKINEIKRKEAEARGRERYGDGFKVE